MEAKYKKFVDNGHGDCIYCNERRHDCRCDEQSAKTLGYHYDCIVTTKHIERPPMPEGLSPFDRLIFLSSHPTSQETSIGIWRKGKTWFKNGYDLVDYHNLMES